MPGQPNHICSVCGKAFYVSPSDTRNNKTHHCSWACRNKAMSRPPAERMEQYTDRSTTDPDGCWEWTAARNQTSGYGFLGICTPDGKPTKIQAHRLAWELAYGPIPAGLFALHRCDNRGCVRPDHLFLGTKKDNTQDMLRKLRGMHGERAPGHKLTEEQVREIRERYAGGGILQRELGAEYGVARTAISRIITGKRWAHLK